MFNALQQTVNGVLRSGDAVARTYRWQDTPGGERGQAMVEFALVLPLLLLLIFGIFDFGRAINYWIDATHMSNEAARYAAVGNTPTGCEHHGQLLSRRRPTAPSCKNGGTLGDEAVQVCVDAAVRDRSGTPITPPRPSTTTGCRSWACRSPDHNHADATMRLENWQADVVGCCRDGTRRLARKAACSCWSRYAFRC